MKIKAGLCGVALLFGAATAYGLGMEGSRVESPAPASPEGEVAQHTTPPTSEQVRAFVKGTGLDPDSPNGQLLAQWASRVAQDPEYRRWLGATSGRKDFLKDAQLPAGDRLKMVHQMKDIAAASADDCRIMQSHQADLVAMGKSMSARGFGDMLAMVDIIAKRPGVRPGEEEHYSVAELLDADARLSAIEAAAPPRNGIDAGLCGVLASVLGAIEAMPEPQRRRATYEFFRITDGGLPAIQAVFDDPSAYLDDVFDERRLPESVHRLLPADGSRPLPWSRVIVEAAWVNRAKPKDATPFRNVFVNRRNNGVVAEVITETSKAGKTSWVDFTLSYGIADLLSQTVKGKSDVTVLATLQDGTAIGVVDRPLVEGDRLVFAVPQPSDKGQTSRVCEAGKSAPASEISSALSGLAVDLDCSEVTNGGATRHVYFAWLPDYGIILARRYDDEYGRTDVLIRNLTVVKP